MKFFINKNIKILTILACMFVFFSCKKKEILPINDEPESSFSTIQYNLGNNVSDGLIGNISSTQMGVSINVFGATDANGDFLKINSINLQRNASDTIYNFVLDDFSRIDYFFINVNGINENRVHKITYTDNDSVYFSVHAYNWSNGDDSLLYLTGIEKINGDYKSTTIFLKNNSWLSDKDIVKAAFVVGTAALAAVGIGGVAVGALVYLGTNSAFAAAMAVVVLAMGNANAGTIADLPPNPPQSPSSNIITELSILSDLEGVWIFTYKTDGTTRSITKFQINNYGLAVSKEVTYDSSDWGLMMSESSTVVKLMRLSENEINFYLRYHDDGAPDPYPINETLLIKTDLNKFEASITIIDGVDSFVLEKL